MAQESDTQHGRNLFDHGAITTDVGHTRNLLTENARINSPRMSSYSVDSESLVHHDPIKEANYEGARDSVFTAVAHTKSVPISVDKWSSDPATVRVMLPEKGAHAVVDNTRMSRPEMGGKNTITCDDGAIYSVVNKTPKTTLQNSPENEADDDGFYGKVNKAAKTMQQNGGQNDAVNFAKAKLQSAEDDEDIGNSDDLEDGGSRHQKNLFACIDGKVMIVSDEGDYASVDTLSDSDISKMTESTRDSIISLEPQAVDKKSVSSESKKPKSENDLGRLQSRYAVQYLGSLPVAEQDLSPQICTQVVGQCIIKIAQQSSETPAEGLTYEWEKDAKMILEISETRQSLKLLNSSSGVSYDDHYLYVIRIWAVGKEINSKYFAYVIRNESKRHVCRVFLCDVAARCIATTIRNICQRLATPNERKAADNLTQRSGVGSVGISGNTENERNGSSKHVSKPSGVGSMKVASTNPTVITCCYMGIVPAGNSSAKDVVNAASRKVFTDISKDKWRTVSIQLSPTEINIKDISDSDGCCMSLPLETVTHVGSSTKDKNLAAILTREKDDKIHARVFYCEHSAKELVQKVQAACQLSSSALDLRLKDGDDEIRKQKGISRLFQGKAKAK